MKFKISPTYFRAFRWFIFYLLWVWIVPTIILTLLTYLKYISFRFGLSADFTLKSIGEQYSSNEIIILGFTSASFLLFARSLNPIILLDTHELLPLRFVRERLGKGLIRGATIIAVFVTVLTGFQYYKYLGIYLNLDNLALTGSDMLIRILAIALFAYSEEFIFRQKIFRTLNLSMPTLLSAVTTSGLYLLIKIIQFDLSHMQVITLFLFSGFLCLLAAKDKTFVTGAGISIALFVSIHILFSLPIFGNEFSGLLMLKYLEPLTADTRGMKFAQFLSGGQAGPMASFGLQALFLVFIVYYLIRRLKPVIKGLR